MIFRVKSSSDEKIDEVYKEAIREMEKFFGIKWTHRRPNIFIVPDRRTIDPLLGYKTPKWLVAWAEGKDVFILDRKSYGKESVHKYSWKKYVAAIKHELAHSFLNSLFNTQNMPGWLLEGLAMYLSEKERCSKMPKKFSSFLEFYTKNGPGIYKESGHAVYLLIKRFGRGKILKLLKCASYIKTKKEFYFQFERIYGFKLNYTNFNKLLKL